MSLIVPRCTPSRPPRCSTGYGGYGLSYKASFQPSGLLWLERGFVLGVSNIRGGGEYGDAWRQGGRLPTKQNCFDDFAACARHLVSTGVTTATGSRSSVGRTAGC